MMRTIGSIYSSTLTSAAAAHLRNVGRLSAKIRGSAGADEAPPLLRRRQGSREEDRPRLSKIGVDEEIYVVDLKKGEVSKGAYEGKPDATFSFKDSDFIAVATGKMNPQMAFIRGAMKIKGSLSAAQKFTPDIFPKPSKL
ncbi:hydroxysteroid dehydrogenase-like protein 2 [Cinnamomum micranthum f. kanehirae]|uniref:Hydroxysteroid dehydrogenase-like protein 2 n=1 Tax=Cinnamomum micranthum f. kanehirae TaxID=337451 RepID=A0A443P044_9MAGN|nr:hydroxysteroid dehydrogenase-like protein 2 [Cinnamomum micranthum f. kanehirae]